MESKLNYNASSVSSSNELVLIDEENKFYCEKCYDMVNYFIGECLTYSPQLTELKSRFSRLKKCKSYLKSKYETLEFNYEEEKAQREDLEERLLAQRNKSCLVRIHDIDMDLRDFHIQTNINKHFFLDLECLTKQITTETTLNLEIIFTHFAQKANEFRKKSANTLILYKQKLARGSSLSNVRPNEPKESAMNEQKLMVLSDENEQLKVTNKTLSESLDAFMLENKMLKASSEKVQDSFQKLNVKYEQTENQVIELEKMNQDLLEHLKEYEESKSKFIFILVNPGYIVLFKFISLTLSVYRAVLKM